WTSGRMDDSDRIVHSSTRPFVHSIPPGSPMTHERTDEELIREERNSQRFFVENRHIGWVLLAAVVLAGIFGYQRMPKRKDPDVPVRVALAACAWPGANPVKVEQLVARPIEEQVALNASVQ